MTTKTTDRKQALVLIFSLCCWFSLQGQSDHAHLRKGDHAYNRDLYKEAEQHYRNAADRDVRNEKSFYNLGNALYQQGKFEEAGQKYQQALARTENQSNETLADTWHNLGNAMLKQRKYQEAVKSFQQSLRYRPGDEESKMNLQMAKKKLQEEQQRQKEQQQKQQQQQDQNNPSQQPNQPPPPNNNQNPEQPQQPPQQPQQDQQQQQQQKQQLKKEEAKRLLETAINNEDRKNARKYRAADQSNPQKRSKKDW